MLNRRTFLAGATTALALAATGCATATATSPSPSATASASATAPLATPTIGLTYIPNVQFSPFYVAEADQLFTAAGVKPTLRHHGASEGLFTALAAGEEQFVIAGGDEVLQARSADLPLVAVSAYYRSYPVVIIVPADSGITTLAGLKGRTIGVPGKYGESWFGLLVALQTAGLTAADVTVQEIGYTQQAALTTKKVDAIVGFSNNDSVQFAQAGFATRNLPIADGDVPLVGICLITTAAYATDNPATVKAVAAGMLAGISAVVADPDRALTVSAEYVPGLNAAAAQASAKATLTATLPLWTGSDGTVDGQLDPAQWTAMADFMAATGLTATKVDPTPAYSNGYLG
ncbi:MAG TPA: ABC transporter substrate-binding protein [Propionicimonas sp.]|nr:ABC transporter substrate-binding protein [Propionicimonas sp.]